MDDYDGFIERSRPIAVHQLGTCMEITSQIFVGLGFDFAQPPRVERSRNLNPLVVY
jgi:hypothetical protein